MENKVKCEGCGKEFRNVTHKHIRKCLNISIGEYKIRYPEAELICEESRRLGAKTLENMIRCWGEEDGRIRWRRYCDRQSLTNTFEYKRDVYGWDEDQFDSYNSSRSVTLENLILRHGESVGREKWKSYCDRQAYAGVTEEYFIEKHGEIEGKRLWEEQSFCRGRSLEFFISKYGEDEGRIRHEKSWGSRGESSRFSKSSQKLFDLIFEKFPDIPMYYATKNKEFGKMCPDSGRYYFYDFAIPSLNFIVEYNGDHWHANPKIYEADFIPKNPGISKTAKSIWDYDAGKIKVVTDMGFKVYVVWESEFVENKDSVFAAISKEIEERLIVC